MQYTLMHKNHKVMELTISQDSTQILHVGEIFDERRIPVGLRIPLRKSVNHWWRRRAIPASRSGLSQALRSLHLNAPEELLTKCFGLSLSDQYWVKPVDADMTWEQVNFLMSATFYWARSPRWQVPPNAAKRQRSATLAKEYRIFRQTVRLEDG